MMATGTDIKGLAAVGTAAFIGSSIGNELGAYVRDELEARRRRARGLPEAEKRVYLQTLGEEGVTTTTLVATVLALQAERRRPLWGFLLAVLLTALVGDRFDRLVSRSGFRGETTNHLTE